MKVETALWVKRQASNVRFYSPVILDGTVYVGAAVSGFIYFTLQNWKAQIAQGISIDDLDIKLLWAGAMWTTFVTWSAYRSKKVAEHAELKKRRDETEATSKDQPGRLTHLG